MPAAPAPAGVDAGAAGNATTSEDSAGSSTVQPPHEREQSSAEPDFDALIGQMQAPTDEDLLADVGGDPFFLSLAGMLETKEDEEEGGEHETKEPEEDGEAAAAKESGEDGTALALRPPELALEEATVRRLREEISRLHVPDYKTELERAARAEQVTLGLLSPEEVAEREAALEDARVREAAREAERFARREAALALRQSRAKARVVQDKAAAARAVRSQEIQALESRAEVEAAVRRAYREARAALAAELRRQQAVVMERFGVLEEQPQGSLARARLAKQQIRVAWSHVPQPLRLTVHQVRGVKNRVPRGRYVLLATLWDRLGGRPLRWSRMSVGAGAGSYRGLARPASTRPVRHAGRFYSTELDFQGQQVHTLCPAAIDLAPSNCIVLELFLLGGKRSPVDRVVAWTALPCSDSDLRPVEGRFLLPMLRGEVDLDVDQFSKMEQRWGRDLDNWLGNLYVEVARVPREQIGDGDRLVGEFDVEIGYTSEVLRLRQSRLRSAAAAAAAEEQASRERPGEGRPLLGDLGDGRDNSSGANPAGAAARGSLRRRQGGRFGRPARKTQEQLDEEWDQAGSGADDDDQRGSANDGGDGVGRSLLAGRRPKRGKASTEDGGLLSAAWESDEEAEDEWEGGVGAVTNRIRAKTDAKRGRVERAVPGASRSAAPSRWKLKPLANLASYGYAVSKQEARGIGRGRRLGEGRRKGVYLRQELWGDLLPRGCGTRCCTCRWNTTAALQLLVLIIALYLRAHVHYIGQWLFLQAQRIPVYELSLVPWGMVLKYVGSVLPMEMELGIVIVGPLTVLLMFGILCAICFVLFRLTGHIPETVSRFVAFAGVAAVLDPLLILVADLASLNFGCDDPTLHPACVADFTSAQCRCFEGDMFKLYYRFLRTEGSGVVGVTLTVFVYAVEMLLAGFLLYGFLVNLHLDGRMLDLYRRIHAPDSAFRQPLDLELSLAELGWVVDKARRWDMQDKVVRRVAVCEYVLTDPLDPSFREVTNHLVIYNATLGGTRELFRHFLQLPDGTLVEVFGDLESALGGSSSRRGEATPLQQVLLKAAREDDEAVRTFFGGL